MDDSKSKIKAAGVRRFTQVELSIGPVHLRSLTQREYMAIEANEDTNRAAWYVAMCHVDADGNRMWGDHEIEDIANLDMSIIIELVSEINKFCLNESIGTEEAEKN